MSAAGAQGGRCCVVLQPRALWDHPAPQLGAGPGGAGSPGDGGAVHGL